MLAENDKIGGIQPILCKLLQKFTGLFLDTTDSYAVISSYLAMRFRKLFDFSEKNRFFRTFHVHFCLLPDNRRSLYLKLLLIKITKIFSAKKNPMSEFFLTMAIFKKSHFLSISGYVPKMALAIYMRGDKKS